MPSGEAGFRIKTRLPSGCCLPPPPPRCPVDPAHVARVLADRLPAAPQAPHPVPAEGVQDHSGGGVHGGAGHPGPAPDV